MWWTGDVGQNAWGAGDFQTAGSGGGENCGWHRLEGTHSFGSSPAPPGAIAPVYEYSHDGGRCVVTGGYVYRGRSIPALVGWYVFGDFCGGRLEAIRLANGRVSGHAFLGSTVPNLSSFGEDGAGELYALSLSGAVFRLAPGWRAS